MAWMLVALLLIPLLGLPVLRMVFAPRRAGPVIPWSAFGIGLALLVALWAGFGMGGKPADPAPSYVAADSAVRALIE